MQGVQLGPLFFVHLLLGVPTQKPLMTGIVRLMVYKNGVSNVIDCRYDEVKATRLRLSREGWVLYHSEVL